MQLTSDGEKHYTFNRENEGELGGRCLANDTHWIPGTHRFYAVREDNRKVGDLWVVNALAEPYPEQETYKIQELHLPIYHALCLMLEERFYER